MKRKQLGRINLSGENPKIDFNSLSHFRDDLRDFKDGERIYIIIERYYRKRTKNQNSVLHWYIDEIAKETGMENEDVKEFLSKKFLTVDLLDGNGELVCDPETGEVLQKVRRTSELNTVEFNDFTEKIRLWSLEFLNIHLPLPNEPVELNFKK